MKAFTLASFMGILAFASANAQEFSHFTVDVGGGFTEPVRSTSNYYNLGWNVEGGVGVNFFSWLGLKVDVGYHDLSMSGVTAAALGGTNGYDKIFTATLDPIVYLTPHRPYHIYVTGGAGYFDAFTEYTRPLGTATTPSIPVVGPINFGTNSAVSGYTNQQLGTDIGAGVSFGAPHTHGQFFMEAKWDHMFLPGSTSLDFIPVTFGFRW